MVKKYVLFALVAVAAVIVASFAYIDSASQFPNCLACESEGGVVDKAPCEAFTVKIGFKNTGTTEGTWSVNIAFEGESWSWSGAPLILTLKPCKTKTLTWNGSVPCDAPNGSTARLIVYHNDSFTRLDWWIHVVSNAELTITSSTVK